MSHIADQLQKSIDSTNSLACVGLDPRVNLIPPTIARSALEHHGDSVDAVCDAFLRFNIHILDAISGHCAAIKPQLACYEAYGSKGLAVFEQSVRHARKLGIPVIVDGKRNDIGSTAKHYQEAYLGSAPGLSQGNFANLEAEWLTINAYLGSDGVLPFLDDGHRHGVYILVKTSNPGSGEFQGLASQKQLIMEEMADLVNEWGKNRLGECGLSSIGAVVGATYPDEARSLRARMPNTPFLVPGYGAQGGSAADALAGLREDGTGVLVNSSRGIIACWQQDGEHTWADDDFAGAARWALEEMNKDLNSAR